MILIPAGEFLMGSDPQKDKDARTEEQPQHTIHLPNYYLAKTPVTNAQYATFIQETTHNQPHHWANSYPPPGKADHPVIYVSWYDAIAYCQWLSEVTEKPYRLPTEAEWEKGARSTDGRIYPWGNQGDVARCNSRESGKNGNTPVDAYPKGASPYGVLDMVGNIWEWTRSLWGTRVQQADWRYPYDPHDGREEVTAANMVHRVLRGGAFSRDLQDVRCACRFSNDPRSVPNNVGFRVVR
jgi:formylglycine-generating enzyme required for sulfatase activity